MSIDLTQKITIANGFRLQWEGAQDAYVLLYPEGMVKLNQTAGEILSRIENAQDGNAVIAALQSSFPGADLADDVIDFLKIADKNSWINFE